MADNLARVLRKLGWAYLETETVEDLGLSSDDEREMAKQQENRGVTMLSHSK
jgi:hypothetical protein